MNPQKAILPPLVLSNSKAKSKAVLATIAKKRAASGAKSRLAGGNTLFQVTTILPQNQKATEFQPLT